jgi:hypothetical protein
MSIPEAEMIVDLDSKQYLAWVVDSLLSDRLTTSEFEEIVSRYWDSGRFVRRLDGPLGVADRILRRVESCPECRYGVDIPWVRFSSHLLFGKNGQPGAIHVRAPGERLRTNRLREKNRSPHMHLEGRITIITSGRAIFYVLRSVGGTDCMIETPVRKDDVIFWPPRAVHTFDAGRHGFSLCSAMGRFIDAAGESFAIPAEIDCDALQRVPYAGFVTKTAHDGSAAARLTGQVG